MQTGRGPLQHGCTTMLQQLLNPNWVIAMSQHVWTQQMITFHCSSEENPFFAHPVGSSVSRHCIHNSEDQEDTVVSTSIMKRKFKHEQPKPTSTGMSGPMWRNNAQLTSLQLTVILEEEGSFPHSKQVGFLPDEDFDGDIPELSGRVYELVGSWLVDLFTRTTKHIARYITIKYQHGSDIHCMIEARTHSTIQAQNCSEIAT